MKVSSIALLLALIPSAAFAGGPAGKWRVADGKAVVAIKPCGKELCGSIASVSDQGGLDENNPDPKLRTRNLVGLPMLSLKPEGDNQWSGSVYNATNGQNYEARLSMKSDAELTLEGCVVGTNVCGTENWSRAK